MALTVLKRQPAEQMAADALKEEILTGALKPGQRLTEAELSEQSGVSRGTIRIALHQLSGDGLVVLKPYTGWSVVSFEPHDMWEIYTLRGSLEAMAARLATEQLDKAGAERLSQVSEALFSAARAGEVVAELMRKDFELHRCVVELSHNSRLTNHYRMVEQQVRMFISSTYSPGPDRSVLIEHHAPMVEAILRRKPRLAARLFEHHSTSEGERILALASAEA